LKKLATTVLVSVRDVLIGRFMVILCAPNRPPALHNPARSAGGGKAASGIAAFSSRMSQTQLRFCQSLQLAAVASSV
jgi:hypothetical protein